jgi:hypothetical protein
MGKLLAQTMLGQTTELPLFDPARLIAGAPEFSHREWTQ